MLGLIAVAHCLKHHIDRSISAGEMNGQRVASGVVPGAVANFPRQRGYTDLLFCAALEVPRGARTTGQRQGRLQT